MIRVEIVKGGLVGMFVACTGCLGLAAGPEEATGTGSGSPSTTTAVDEGSRGTRTVGTLGETQSSSSTTASTLRGTNSATGTTGSETEPSSTGSTSSGSSDESGEEIGGSGSGQLAFTQEGSVVMIDPSTGDEVLLTADHFVHDFVWDPDGSGIYFGEYTPGGGHVLHRANLEGQTSAILTSDRYPYGLAVSSDGQRLGWLALDPEQALDPAFVVVNVDGSDLSEVSPTPPHPFPTSYAFAPDFEHLAWCPASDVRHAPLPGGVSVSLATGFCVNGGMCATYGPAYSPSASQLVFTVGEGSAPYVYNNLWVVSTDGTGLTNITADLDVEAWGGRWSSEGDRIAFTASDDIYVVGSDGAELQNLSNSKTREREPAWSPSGLQLAWVRGMTVENDVIVYDFVTEQSVLVATGAFSGVLQGTYSPPTPVVAWRPSPE